MRRAPLPACPRQCPRGLITAQLPRCLSATLSESYCLPVCTSGSGSLPHCFTSEAQMSSPRPGGCSALETDWTDPGTCCLVRWLAGPTPSWPSLDQLLPGRSDNLLLNMSVWPLICCPMGCVGLCTYLGTIAWKDACILDRSNNPVTSSVDAYMKD